MFCKGLIYTKAIYVKDKLFYGHIAVILSNKIFFHRFLHAYVQYVYIVYVKYWTNSAKSVVGVNQPMKALSMIIRNSYKGNIVLISVILSKNKIF